MFLDSAKKAKKTTGPVDLQRQQNFDKKNDKKKDDRDNKKDIEEKIETSFSNFSNMAHHHKIKVVWAISLAISSLIIISWFYLVSKGVIFNIPSSHSGKNELAKLSTEFSSGFNNIKNQLDQKKELVGNLKKELEKTVIQNEFVNNLKDNLSQTIKDQSKNIIVKYPLSDSYINNPVQIIGRGQVDGSEFEIKIKDVNEKILGETTGLTDDEQSFSSFALELAYSQPDTATGTIEIFFSDVESNNNTPIVIPIRFIPNLASWQQFQNEEIGFSFRYPSDWRYLLMEDDNKSRYLQFNTNKKLKNKERIIVPAIDSIGVHYYHDIDELNSEYSSGENILNYDNLEMFLSSKTIIAKEKSNIYLNNLEFNFLSSDINNTSINYYFIQKESGEIVMINTNSLIKENNLDILDQILVTMLFVEPDFESWNSYEDYFLEFKYPKELSIVEDFGQIVFGGENLYDFSFYLSTMEPQIDNLSGWMQQSVEGLNEEVINQKNKVFGGGIKGIYYETTTKDMIVDVDNKKQITSLGYLFNYQNATYSIKTNSVEFPNTFQNILDSIVFRKIRD